MPSLQKCSHRKPVRTGHMGSRLRRGSKGRKDMASGCIRTPWGLGRRTCPTEPLQSGGLRAHVAESLIGQDKLPQVQGRLSNCPGRPPGRGTGEGRGAQGASRRDPPSHRHASLVLFRFVPQNSANNEESCWHVHHQTEMVRRSSGIFGFSLSFKLFYGFYDLF